MARSAVKNPFDTVQRPRGTWTHARLAAGLLAVLLGAGSCNAFPGNCAQQAVVCVGLVTGYGTVNAGIEHQAWLALQDSAAAGSVHRIDYIETVDTRDRTANIAYFVDSGYDIVITIGDGIRHETIAAASQHPEVLFVMVQPGHDAPRIPENLIALEFPEEQGGFLAGSVAALLTRTNRVAAVCEARFVDYVERYCEGFAAGVHFANLEVRTQVVYRSGADELLFQDTTWGTTTSAQMVEGGADVVFAVGEATAGAALQEAARRGALVIGAQVDIAKEMPDIQGHVATSVVLNVRESLTSLIRSRLNGQLLPGPHPGTVGLGPFLTDDGRLSPNIAAKLLSIEADLHSGRLVPHVPIEAH